MVTIKIGGKVAVNGTLRFTTIETEPESVLKAYGHMLSTNWEKLIDSLEAGEYRAVVVSYKNFNTREVGKEWCSIEFVSGSEYQPWTDLDFSNSRIRVKKLIDFENGGLFHRVLGFFPANDDEK